MTFPAALRRAAILILATLPVALALHAEDASEIYPLTPELRRSIDEARSARLWRQPDDVSHSRRRWKRAWIASWIGFVAASVVDAHSSAGRREVNPLLRGADGRFSPGKAWAVKGGLGAAFFLYQQQSVRRHPERNGYKTFTFATASAAGACASGR